MQDLLDYLQKQGFSVPALQLNGKIIRWDIEGKKKDGWLIGWEHFSTSSGKPYVVCEFGRWSTGEEHKFKSGIEYSPEDLAFIKRETAKAAREREEEKRKVNEDAAKEAQEIWRSASETGSHPYIEKKRLGGLHGARIKEGASTELLVPVQDGSGKMWGLQRIFSEGGKYFLGGQKTTGCFCRIGKEPEGKKPIIYIAEGFATAASVHIATGGTTFAAFNAGNLEEAGRAIRERYRNARIIIAADNDALREGGNIGVEKAQEAARRIGAKVVAPTFLPGSSGKLTDFNDLMVSEGIAAVRDQLQELPPEDFVLALGYSGDNYYYTSSHNPAVTVLAVPQHCQNHFFHLMKKEYWVSRYEEKKGIVDWSKASSSLMDECRKRGVFDPHKVRGAGGWSEEDGSLVLNLGGGLFSKGREMGLSESESESLYTLAEAIPPPLFPALATSESRSLLRLIESFNWKHAKYAKFLAGFLTVAPFCGALKWRPHLWVTGPSGSGKSTLFDYLIRPLVGGFGESVGGNSTEAGIRQTLRYNAKCVVFDEFETNDKRSNERIKGILDFMRLASSDSESSVLKGGAHGSSSSYKPRASFIVGSVRVNLTQDTDKNRFTVIELKGSGNSPDQWEKLERELDIVDEEFCRRLHARTVEGWEKIQASAKAFQKILGKRFNQRFGQQHGILLAGYWSLLHDDAATLEDAEATVNSIDWSDEVEAIKETDAQDILDFLLHKKVSVKTSDGLADMSIHELIEQQREADLKRLGLKLTSIHEKPYLVIARSHPELKKLFETTTWMAGWARSFAQLEGAITNKQFRFGAYPIPAVCFPFAPSNKENPF